VAIKAEPFKIERVQDQGEAFSKRSSVTEVDFLQEETLIDLHPNR
jgi:hypothetical protein